MTKVTHSQKSVLRRRASNSCEKCGRKIKYSSRGCLNGSVHHRLPQRMGGRHTITNLVLVCNDCHRGIHRNEFLASLTGWIAWHDPDVTPVLRQGRRGRGWALLVPDGSLEHLTHREGEHLCAFANWCPQAS